jgi:DNA polymerase-3 subunit delta'
MNTISGTGTRMGWTHLPSDLKGMLESGRIPNALLFTGSRDSGRAGAALTAAMSVNCLSQEAPGGCEPCGQCSSCRKIEAGTHPDILETAPVKDRIRIGQIRDIAGLISSRPHEARRRMVLIRDAGRMNAEASNALLKMLEEPPGGTFFVLLAQALTDLLPTVISRCLHIRFKPVSRQELADMLRAAHALDPATALMAASLADGSPETAGRLLDLAGEKEAGTRWIPRRRWLIQEISLLIEQGKPGKAGCGNALLLAEKLARETDLLTDSLSVVRSWLRDLAVLRYSPENVVNTDFRDLAERVSRDLSPQQLLSWVEDLHVAETGLRSNTVPRVTLEHFFLKLCCRRAFSDRAA